MRCPSTARVSHYQKEDEWETRNTGPDTYCSYCGSQHPDAFMRDVEEGAALTPTDKAYKVYGKDHQKFYFEHLSVEQRTKFIELLNAGKVNLGMLGRFFVTPFFMKRV